MLNDTSGDQAFLTRAVSEHPNLRRSIVALASGLALVAAFGCSGEDKPGPLQNGGSPGTAGQNSNGGSSAGNVALGGSATNGGSTGAAGAGAGAGGSGGIAQGGSGGDQPVGGGGSGGAPIVDPPPDQEPNGLRIVGQNVTASVIRVPEKDAQNPTGAIGGTVLWDTCPDDHVLIGFDHYFLDFVNGLKARCGKVSLTGSPDAYTVLVDAVTAIGLETRGGVNATGGTEPNVVCPANQVLVGFEARYNDWIRWLTLSCAPLVVSGSRGNYKVELGAVSKLPIKGRSATDARVEIPFPHTQCPAGMVARGSRMNAGIYIETFGLSCGTPTLTHPDGTVCARNATCASAVCNGETCDPAPETCDAPTGCVCASFDAKPYIVCGISAKQSWSDAQATCVTKGMHLVHPQTGVENGWLRRTADVSGAPGPVWLGATDAASADNWKWTDDSQVPFALQEFDGREALWHEQAITDPSNLASCAALTSLSAPPVTNDDRPGAWDDLDCAGALPFICEKD